MSQGFQDYLSRGPRAAGMLPNTARELGRRWDGRRVQYEEMPYFTAPEITRAAISWLELNRGTPFFLFLNYLDVHAPNAAPGDQGVPFEDERPMTAADRKKRDADHGPVPLSAAVRRGLVNEYDRELIHLDRWVGVLFDYLEKSDLNHEILVVLTSDHGEYLGEHEIVGHLKDIHAEVTDVPLVIWQPGWTPGRTSRPVQLLDLFPTILQYLELPVPEGTQGQPVMEVEHPIVSELSGSAEIPNIRTIRIGEYRYFGGADRGERLFHRPSDPGEQNNLLLARPEHAALGRARLDEWLKGIAEAPPSSVPPAELDAEALEGLRALGYVH
jgi:arylsulfatase A-like enzyme